MGWLFAGVVGLDSVGWGGRGLRLYGGILTTIATRIFRILKAAVICLQVYGLHADGWRMLRISVAFVVRDAYGILEAFMYF